MVRPASALIAIVALSGCAGLQGHSGSTTDYAHKAVNTAETVGSSVSTALFAIELSTRGRITSATLSVTLRESYDDASATAGGFDSVQPPTDQADALHTKLGDIDQGAVEALRDALVHARRGESLGRFESALIGAKKDLDGFHPGYGA